MSSFVASLLQHYLGDFLEGLTSANLKISLLSGLVEQRNVRFRPEALKNLNLPVVVKSGSIELLSVQLPSLGSLSTQATRVVMDQVYIVAGPGHALYDAEFDRRALETKKRRLQVAEALKTDPVASGGEEDEASKPGFFGRSSVGKLAESMVQNLTVHIKSLHVRYEDVDASGQPFAAGLTLESLQAEAASPDWQAAVGALVEGVFRKLVSLRHLSVYWDQGSAPLAFATGADMVAQMKALVFTGQAKDPPVHSYVVPPVCGTAKFTVNLNFEQTLKPQVQIAFAFGAIAVNLEERQWRQLTRILDGVSSEIRGVQYRHLRPVEAVERAPRLWWAFAIAAVASDVRHKREALTWPFIEAYAADRRAYTALWYIKLRAGRKKGCWTAAQRQLKRDIVARRSFEQLMSFRAIAESLMVRQRTLVRQAVAGTSNPFKRSKLEAEIMDINVATMPASEWYDLRFELQRLDEFHASTRFQAGGSSKLPPDYVRRDVMFELAGAALQLRGAGAAAVDIVSLALTTVSASYRGLEDGTTQVSALLQSLDVVDRCSRGPGVATTVVHPTSSAEAAAGVPLVQVAVELPPRGPRQVRITARSLDIVFSVPLVLRIRDFFAAGGAAEALVHLREDAVSAAARAIISKATVPTHLSVKIDAPNVVFCDDFREWPRCTRLIGALGRLTLSSTESDVYHATVTDIRACLAYPPLEVWQDALAPDKRDGKGDHWVSVLQETSLDVLICVKHGVRVHSESTVCVTGTFTSVPRIDASKQVVVEIVRVSLGLALSAIEFGGEAGPASVAASTPAAPSKTAVSVELLMPSIEIVAATLAEDRALTRLQLDSTRLTVFRDFVGAVDVSLGIGSLTAVDCLDGPSEPGAGPPRMVWSAAAAEERQHVLLHVRSLPGDGAVNVELDIFQLNLSLRRRTALEVVTFTEALAVGIVDIVPPQLRSKKTVAPNASSVSFRLRTGGVAVTLLKRAAPFLCIGLAASRVELEQFRDDRFHLELYLGAIAVTDPLVRGPYGRLLVTSGEHTAAITVDTSPREDPRVVARVSSLTFVFLSRLLRDVSHYFAELEEMLTTLRVRAGQAAANAVRSSVRPSVRLDLDAVTVVVPAESTDERCVRACVHHVALAAHPDGRLELAVTGVTAGTAVYEERGVFSRVRPVLHEWTATVVVQRRVTGQWGDSPDLAVSCDCNVPLHVSVDADQVALCFDIVERNLLQTASPDGVLDVTMVEVLRKPSKPLALPLPQQQQLRHSFAPPPPPESAVVTSLPVWIRVRVTVSSALVGVGAAEGVGLGTLQCGRITFDLDAFDRLACSLVLSEAHLLDARRSRTGSSARLLEGVGDGDALTLQFQRSLGHFDDLGLTLGAVRVVLDPKWLLALFHVLLPVVDRMLTVAEKLAAGRTDVGGGAVAAAAGEATQAKEGMHVVLRVRGVQVVSMESDDMPRARAIALSSSLIVLERTETPDGRVGLDVLLHDVEVWKTRYSTDERASMLFPVLVSLGSEDMPGEVSSLAVTVGVMTLDFSYQDLLLSHAVALYWMGVWSDKASTPAAAAPEAPASSRSGALPVVAAADAEFRLELASNRVLCASMQGAPPRLTLEMRSKLSVQQLRFSGGRVVFQAGKEAQWCLTVNGAPRPEAEIFVVQAHPAKAAAQLWDWLPVDASSPNEGRFVLRAHPAWCVAAAAVAMSGGDEVPFVLEQISPDDDVGSRQLWHVPAAVARSLPVATSLAREPRRRSESPAQHGVLPERLVVPDRWARVAPPRQQVASLFLEGGLHLCLVDDLAGNVRPIARLDLAETSFQVSNWSNGGDTHCVFTVTMQADYFNEDSEAWEPLLRGMADVADRRARERSLDIQLSANRAAPREGAPAGPFKVKVETSQAVSLTVSRAFVPTAIRLWEAWDVHRSAAAHGDESVSRPEPLPPRLCNETGQAIRWRGLQGLLEKDAAGSLATGASVCLPLRAAHVRGVVGLRVGNGRWLACPMDSIKSHTFRLDDGLTCVVDVERSKNGGRDVMVRSNVVVENLSDQAVWLDLGGRDVALAAGGQYAVPFDALHLPLRLCPDLQKYELSDRSVVTGTLLQRTPLKEAGAAMSAAAGSAAAASSAQQQAPQIVREAHDVFRCQHTLGGLSYTWAVEVQGHMTDDSARAWTWRVRCRPPLTLRNLLHAETQYRVVVQSASGNKDEYDELISGALLKGDSVQLHRVGNVDALFLQVRVAGFRWSTPLRLGGPSPARGTRLGSILLDHAVEGGARTVTLYASYWLVNESGGPCMWHDGSAPVPGQRELPAGDVGLDGPPVLWFRGREEAAPVLFWEGATLSFEVGRGKGAARSAPLTLGGSVGAMGAMGVDGPNRSRLEFGVQVFNAPGLFWRTKIVQLSNRFVLVNVTGRPLLYGQVQAAQEFAIASGAQLPFHWASAAAPRLLRVRFDDGDWLWSGGFSLQDASLFEVMLRDRSSLQSERIVVQSVTEGPTTAVVFHSARGRTPMYSIRNGTRVPLLVRQDGAHDPGEEVPARATVPFAWADCSATARRVLVLPVAGTGVTLLNADGGARYSLDEVGALSGLSLQGPGGVRRCSVHLGLQGATKVLTIEEDLPDGPELVEDDFDLLEQAPVDVALRLVVPGVSVSLVSGAPSEIFHAFLDLIEVDVEAGPRQQTVQLRVANVQVDSQLRHKVYETVLWGRSSSEPDRAKPFFHLAVNRGLTGNSNDGRMLFFNGVEIVVQELNVSLDEAFVTHALQAAYDLLEFLERSFYPETVRRTPDYTRSTLVTDDMVYARVLFFGPLALSLSYSSCPWGAASLRGDSVQHLLRVLGPVSGLERATLQLNSLRLDNAFATRTAMVKLVLQHYRQAAASRFLKLLGSAHFIGSPITLLESLGTGFWDMWYEPVLGLTHSPQAFAEGVQKGTLSMLSNTVYGVAKSASDLSGSIGNVTAQLSFDPQYIEARERERKQQAQHVGEGLALGAWDFGKGIFDGVTGLVTRPVAGAQAEGAVGFFKGVGQALSGVVVKPVAGTFGAVSRITEGVKNAANRAVVVQRLRAPRFIGADRVIVPFDGMQAEGQEMLWQLGDGAFQTEFYVFHYPPLDEKTRDAKAPRMQRLLASNRHLFCVQGATAAQQVVVWRCSLLSIGEVRRSQQNGVVVEVKGNPAVCLTAPHFYSYEVSWLVLAVSRIVRDAGGQRDANNWDDGAASQPVLPPRRDEDDDRDPDVADFVHV